MSWRYEFVLKNHILVSSITAKVVAFLLMPSFVHASVPAFVVLVAPSVHAIMSATPFGIVFIHSTMYAYALAFKSFV